MGEIEVWRDIEGYGGKYQVSNKGRVQSFKRYRKGIVLKANPSSSKYATVYLWQDNVKRNKTVHRLMLAAFPEHFIGNGCFVDHIDRDKLNNNLSNLRMCNKAQNSANTHKRKNTLSKYKGVCRCKTRWQAKVARRYIGLFKTEEEAAEAYNKEALKEFGEFANINIINRKQDWE